MVPVNGEIEVKSGYVPFTNNWLWAKAVRGGPLAKAKSRVLAASESSNGRPGYLPSVPPQEGI